MDKARNTKLIAWLVACAFLSFEWGDPVRADGGEDKPQKDTAKAVVTYGQEEVFGNPAELSPEELAHLVDSLHCVEPVPYDLIEQLYFYQNIQAKSLDEITAMIDSLFDLEEIPYALINEINIYISKLQDEVPNEYFMIPLDNSIYPANYYYEGAWDHRHPWNYPDHGMAEDSAIVMQLVDPDLNCGFSFPVGWKTIYRYHGTVTSDYGWRDGRSHNGIDLELHKWDSVMSVFPGMVRMARYYSDFGNVVIVRHYNGFETLYAHLSTLKVKEGQLVDAGDLVGLGGATGNASGSHLHLEVRFKGEPIDPEHIINFDERALIADVIELKNTRKGLVAYEAEKEFHTIVKGDSPYKISKRYGLDLDTLCEINGITSSTKLVVGDKFKLDP